MASYTNIKDILKQFELQIVQAKHYKKNEVFTKTETENLIATAVGNINQFNIVIASSAATTPYNVTWNNEGTNVTGTLTAANADTHTIYYVKSANGTNDSYDEYMSVNGSWEKIGNTDVDLSNYSLLTQTVSTINFSTSNGLRFNLASGDSTTFEQLGTAGNWRTFLGATDTVANSSAGLATPKMVYTLKETAVSSSSKGVALGGKVGAPTVTCTSGSVTQGGGSFVDGGTVYSYVTGYAQPLDADLTAIAALTGTSGLLKKTAENTWTLDTNTYLTSSSLSSYATKSAAVGVVLFDSTNGFRTQTVAKVGSTAAADFDSVVTIANLKSGLGINNVTNVATETTITQNSTKNITSGAVYTALNTAVSSSNSGVALGGTVKAPTISVTGGSVAASNGSVVKGGTVYDYISGSSGVLYISDSDFTTMLSEV